MSDIFTKLLRSVLLVTERDRLMERDKVQCEKFHGQKEEKEALSGRVPYLNFKVRGNCEAVAGC